MRTVESLNADAPGAEVVWGLLAGWAPSPAVLADLSAMLYDPPSGGWGVGRPAGPRAECGSERAYRQHLYYKEETCAKCRLAHADQRNRRRNRNPDRPRKRRNRRVTEPRPRKIPPYVCGTYRAYRKHLRDGEPTCDRCRRANADRVAADYVSRR